MKLINMAIKADKPRIIPDEDLQQLQAISSKLKAIREQKGLKFEAFAKHSGVHRTTLFKIEKNGQNLNLSTFLKVLRGLDMTPMQFFQSLEEQASE